ncbi:MAG: transglutaminase-like domain-containing protein [Mobilitalea sp.]
MKCKLILYITMTMLLLSGCTGVVNASNKSQKETTELAPFKGIWEGEINRGTSDIFDMILDVYVKDRIQTVLVSSDIFAFHYLAVDWNMHNNSLIFSMNDEENRATIQLSLSDNNTLAGTYTQYGEVKDITLTKKSNKAVNGKFFRDYPVFTYEERMLQLKEFSDYAEDGKKIPFTYELNQSDEYQELISEYDLDSLTKGYHDIKLMSILLNWVCDNFKHNGSSGLPDERNAIALIDYYKQQSDDINCRGLAIILSEVLRLYGIPAKHITCMPKETLFDDCHVVVHAYSDESKQWIMLDPTYRLILQNEKGSYVNLPILREVLINNQIVIPNENAGRNGRKFKIDDYREYMTKNTFRFECATDFYFGAEDGDNGNVANMLTPLNYFDDTKERNTTSDKVFWAIP